MARKVSTPAPGLFKNGARWWLRVGAPALAETTRVSTGTKDVVRANAILAMRDALQGNQANWEWLRLAATGELPLDTIYAHYAAGTLHQLREERAAVAAALAEPDLDGWVTTWAREHLDTLDIEEKSRVEYERQVRFFIPAGVVFPKSDFTEDFIKAKLATLKGARHDRAAKASSSTKRRYVAALRLFIKYALKRVPLDADPLAGADWLPANGKPREVVWAFDTVMAVLSKLGDGHVTEELAAVALVLGSGLELGALLDQKEQHVGSDAERTIIAPGGHTSVSGSDRKTGFRNERTLFVDEWAWTIFKAWHDAQPEKAPKEPLWSWNTASAGKMLRATFYRAQVAAGLIEEPPVNKSTRKERWSVVGPHTIHDARHTWAVNRSLGLDGEERQDLSFLASNLGHADEQMVMKIYKKQNVKNRLAFLKLRGAKLQTEQRAQVEAWLDKLLQREANAVRAAGGA